MTDKDIMTEETIIPGLSVIMKDLRDAGRHCDPSLNLFIQGENGSHDGLPALLIYADEPDPENSHPLSDNTGIRHDILLSLYPLESDDTDMMILSLYRTVSTSEDKLTYAHWQFPLTGDTLRNNNLLRILNIFDRSSDDEPLYDTDNAARISHAEYIRLNGISEKLGDIGIGHELFVPENSSPFIEITDEDTSVEISYTNAGDVDSWILTIECKRTAETVRYDIPEFGGIRSSDDYGKLIEATEMSLEPAYLKY
ncbi:MAG: hypothetical protein K6G03_04065 [Lachnospiraceae bacterium]|nr:hypothetical protein [Lachnospiraceae bacterium]